MEQEFSKDESANQGYKPRGIGWYRKLFQLDEADKGKQILLEFNGIATNSKIYFNGSELEQNESKALCSGAESIVEYKCQYNMAEKMRCKTLYEK